MPAGTEGTPWISVEVERAAPRDRPYGWTVTIRTPGHLAFHPCMTWDDALRAATQGMSEAVRRAIPITLTRADPVPPSQRAARESVA